ncbi:MAG: beta-glucosidase [Alphaproteobacteria bacterium]
MGNITKKYDNEAKAIVAEMSVAEKAGLCSGATFWTMKAIERLNLPEIMLTDGPHGLRKQAQGNDHLGLNASVPATCFPTAVALAASWDIDLLHEVGVALGEECVANDVAVLLGPGVNMKRHPHCGRNFEYFSEDPLLAGELAAAMINGVQSQGVGTSMKHYAANNQEKGRMVIDTIVDERTLREIYLTAFEIAVKKSQPATIMCAYNQVNGTYCSEHDWLLNQVLRDEWGYEGLVVTDWGAANDRVMGLEAGLDLEMPSSGGMNDKKIVAAIEDGSLSMNVLDKAVVRLVKLVLAGKELKSRQGDYDVAAHHALARKAAAQSAVLLKNDGAALPLNAHGTIAVIGPFADDPRYQGAGSSQVNPTQLDKPLDAIREFVGDKAIITHDAGEDITAAATLAGEADTAILFIGLPPVFEMEGADRTHSRLPDEHNALVNAVCAANPNTIVVLSNGSPVEMPWANDVPAILEIYLAGQAGAGATADILFGAANPSGKLAETFPVAQVDNASDAHFPGAPKQVVYREGLYIGYRDFDTLNKPVLFPFGHGLSYTRFTYANLQSSAQQFTADTAITVTVDVTNSGDVAGAEIVQLYVRDVESTLHRPAKELKSFAKIHLASGETQTVSFMLDKRAFAFYSTQHSDWIVEPGAFDILVGASVADIRAEASVEVIGPALEIKKIDVSDPTNMSDADLAALGCPITPPAPTKPYKATSTIGDIEDTFIGKQLANVITKQTHKIVGKDADEVVTTMAAAMLKEMPLRNLATMSGGAIKEHQLDALIHALNGKYLKAATTAFKKPS